MIIPQTFKNISRFSLLTLFLCATHCLLLSQNFSPGVSFFDSTGYVEYIPGNLPVVISVPHGGYLEPEDIPDRDCDMFTCIRDAYTQELGRSLSEAFFEETGCYPHLIINLLHRKKFDANRDIEEAADGNQTVEQAWYDYHAFIDTAKLQIEQDFGRGLFLDLHGHGHEIQRLELGYRITKSELQLSDDDLEDIELINRSSIRSLIADNLQAFSHSELLRGEYSFGTILENKDIPAVPSSFDPFPEDGESYFSGGYNTGRHGSDNGGDIDGIQIECHQSIRFDAIIREQFADSLAIAINEFLNIHYNDQYMDSYCNLLTSVSNNIETQMLAGFYPNPSSEQLYIQSDLDKVKVQIYNSLGEKICDKTWVGNPLDISYLPAGYYIIQLKQKDQLINSSTLIID